MRTRLLVLLVTVGLLGAATVGAFTVTFPSRLRVEAAAVVDEVGHVLFGSTPGKVEVTNFPATVTETPGAPQLVTLLDHVQIAPNGSATFGPIPVDQFRDLSFLGISDVTTSVNFSFLGKSGGFATPDIPRQGPNACQLPAGGPFFGIIQCTAGGAGGQFVALIPVAGPFLAGEIINGNSTATMTITLQAYLRP